MTQNEVNIIKNAVLDATEAYVDARLENASFVKTQIGVTQGNPTKNSDGKWEHIVICNKVAGKKGTKYTKVLSVGNAKFPANSVVFMIAPNAQYSNQFILGKLDNTPAYIVGGEIHIGEIPSSVPHPTGVDYYFNVNENGELTAYKGAIKLGDYIYNGYNVELDNDGLRIKRLSGGTYNFSIDSSTGAVAIKKGEIDLGSGNFKVTDGGIVTMKKGSININSGQFSVDANGNVICKNITANNTGYIGGFEITSTSLGDPMNSTYAIGMTSGRTSSGCVYAWYPSYWIKMYPNVLEMNNSTIELEYGSSWIHISSQNIESNDKGYVSWRGSDKRYKKNIKDLNFDFSKKLVLNLQPREYEFKSEKGKRYGFIAQEVREVLDNINCKNSRLEFQSEETKMHQLNYDDLIAPITLCIQDLYKQIDALKAEIEAK